MPTAVRNSNNVRKKYITKGKKLLDRNEEVVSSLMDGLIRGGFSMVIAGTSSPASGGEHLLSHYLDMYAYNKGREPFAYHGVQVGVGVVIVAGIYERLKELSADDIKERLGLRDKTDYKKEIEKKFPDSFPIIWREFKKKVTILKELSTTLIQNWDEIKEKVFSLIYSQETVKGYLQDAGCPVHFPEIGVDNELAYQTIMNARYIRGRLTVLDIADELGILKEVTNEVLENTEK